MDEANPTSPAAIPHRQLMDTLERHNGLLDLHARVSRAGRGERSPRSLLAALAHLDPAQAVEWLLSNEGAARAGMEAAELARLLDLVIGEALRSGSPVPAARTALLADRYADLLLPDTLAAVAERLAPEERTPLLGIATARLLSRRPDHPGTLRLACEIAVQAGDHVHADRLLTRLGRADGSAATVQYVKRLRGRLPPSDGPRVRIALLGSYTLDPLVPFVDLECRAAGLVPDFHVAPFNTWEQVVRSDRAGVWDFRPDAAFLAVSVDDLVPALADAPSDAELATAGVEAAERVAEAARLFRDGSDALLVVHGFHSAYRDPRGVAAGTEGRPRAEWIAEWNAELARRLAGLPRVHLLDVEDLLLRRSGGELESPKMRHFARMRLGDRVLGEVARAYARFLVPLKGLARKCVVLDLDNTLWGGVAGEDGPQGIRLGDTSPGSEFVEFQRWLRALVDRGFLLAVVSKNNEADALEVIRGHESMVLREDAFAAVRINWLPKHENVLSVAAELNLGVDSLVFVDDNPDERELMRQMLPQVLTVELPADPALYRQALEALPQLQTLAVTDEDRERTARYRARRVREQVRAAAPSLEDYYHSLEISVEVAPATPAVLPRVHQLFLRTSQFNLTARRYDAARLADLAASPGWRVLTLRARDRFSEHGVVAAATVRVEPARWTVDALLMSCRVIGYGVETALLAAIAAAARDAGAATLAGEYVPTARNRPAMDFYPRHGFVETDSSDAGVGWERPLSPDAVPVPPWIRMVVHNAA